MDIRFDYAAGVMLVGDRAIPLDELRRHILQHWPMLAIRHRLKPVQSGGKTLFTYDWARIFSLAQEGGIVLEDFFKARNLLQKGGSRPALVQQSLF